MADVTQDQVVDYIKGISVLELSQLVKKLEEELGRHGGGRHAGGRGGCGGGAGRSGGRGRGADRVHRHADRDRRRRRSTSSRSCARSPVSGLKEAKDLVESAPKAVKEDDPEGRGRGRSRRSSRTSAPRSRSSSFRRTSWSGGSSAAGRSWRRARTAGGPVRAPGRGRVPVPVARRAIVTARFPIDGRGDSAVQHILPENTSTASASTFSKIRDDGSDPQPDRDSEEVVRALPADEPACPKSARTAGLQSVFKSVFPIKRLPREFGARSSSTTRSASWECKCKRRLSGLDHLRQAVHGLRRRCSRPIPVRRARRQLPVVRPAPASGRRRRLRHLRRHRRHASSSTTFEECQERGMTYSPCR